MFADGRNADLLGNTPMTVPAAFVPLAQSALLHRDEARFALLYRVLWRLQENRALLEDAADADVAAVNAMAKAVRRDIHKMHAFVRFREVETEDGARFVAWFEPQHWIVEAAAPFFVDRFASMQWSIVTPDKTARWDGAALTFDVGGRRRDVPAEDARDADWRAYYAAMFNPARLKVGAMTREMPKHYWRNLPEAQDIPSLVRSAGKTAEKMVAAMPTEPRKRTGAVHVAIMPIDAPQAVIDIAERCSRPTSMSELNAALRVCRACPLWVDATQAVPGEGPVAQPLLALVGEQPGDQEDLAGRPFVGPAGQVLDRALAEAGIDRAQVYITNAVKHFKHEPRGKRRIHQKPDRGEVEICRWWMAHELELVKPKLTVALGNTALSALSDIKGALGVLRVRPLRTREGAPLRATVHPSYLLRLPDEGAKAREYARFVEDLAAAKAAALAA
jgi:DNA polymerase